LPEARPVSQYVILQLPSPPIYYEPSRTSFQVEIGGFAILYTPSKDGINSLPPLPGQTFSYPWPSKEVDVNKLI